jgi:hypothetical protein
MKSRKPKQLEMKGLKGWGGKRKGAGRKNQTGTIICADEYFETSQDGAWTYALFERKIFFRVEEVIGPACGTDLAGVCAVDDRPA